MDQESILGLKPRINALGRDLETGAVFSEKYGAWTSPMMNSFGSDPKMGAPSRVSWQDREYNVLATSSFLLRWPPTYLRWPPPNCNNHNNLETSWVSKHDELTPAIPFDPSPGRRKLKRFRR